MKNNFSCYVFDLDGVLYLGDTQIPHATNAIEGLISSGKKIYFLTNNSGKTRNAYKQKLEAVNGLSMPESSIFTSAYATALVLKSRGAGKRVFVVGEAGLAEELSVVAGMDVITVADSVPEDSIDYVVAGIDRQFTYDKLRFAHGAITRGHAEFYATNRDSTFPMEVGEIPGGGSLVAAIATATGIEPTTIGKPETHAYEAILEVAKLAAKDSVMVGDRLDTDIAVGRRSGAATILVLTGVTSRAKAEAATGDEKPDFILNDLSEL